MAWSPRGFSLRTRDMQDGEVPDEENLRDFVDKKEVPTALGGCRAPPPQLCPGPWIPALERVRDRVSEVTGQTFNFVLINRYKGGCDHIREHRDDERELAPGSPIASFGTCRDFLFQPKDSGRKNCHREVEVVRLQLAHGSLLVMNHPTNTYWYQSSCPQGVSGSTGEPDIS